MLRPTPEEVLASISYTFDELIRPDPTSALAVSYAMTVSNMLRQLMLTMKHEERAISEDSAELREVLNGARIYFSQIESGTPPAADIASALSRNYDGPEPAHWARENWRALRRVLEVTIKYLQQLRDECGSQAEYRTVRQTIRDYLDHSLRREAVLIDGAFTVARR